MINQKGKALLVSKALLVVFKYVLLEKTFGFFK